MISTLEIWEEGNEGLGRDSTVGKRVGGVLTVCEGKTSSRSVFLEGKCQGKQGPCLFNLYAEYIMRNVGLGETTSWNQDCREKVSNLRYTDQP